VELKTNSSLLLRYSPNHRKSYKRAPLLKGIRWAGYPKKRPRPTSGHDVNERITRFENTCTMIRLFRSSRTFSSTLDSYLEVCAAVIPQQS
jgi:hypothetical protein